MHLLIRALLIGSMLIAHPVAARTTDETLGRLSPEARDWVNRSCPQSLGPSLWSSCVFREAAAAARGKPNLSDLKPELRAWVERSCPDSLGPSLAISCLQREKAALAGGFPDVSKLSEAQKQWVARSCPQSLGPSLYVSCVRRETQALHRTQAAPQQPGMGSPPANQRIRAAGRGSMRDSYLIEAAHDDEVFIINGEKFEAQTYCLGWEEGDEILFLEGDPFGACTSAEIFNLRAREKCSVWCE